MTNERTTQTCFQQDRGESGALNPVNRNVGGRRQPVDHGGKCTATENHSFSPGTDEDLQQLQQAHRTAEEEPEGDQRFLPGNKAELQQCLWVGLGFIISGGR